MLSAYFALAAGSGSARGAEPNFPPPELVRAPIDKVFVPQGFDDNDNVEVILHGQFPNTCYKTGPVSVEVDRSNKIITIEARSYRAKTTMCAQVLVKFIQPVQIGILEHGTYKLVIKDNPNVAPYTLEIAAARSASQDEHLYAPVSVASIDTNAEGHDILRLEGNYPYMLQGCLVHKEVRTNFMPNDVLVVQPISILTDGEACMAQHDSAHYKIEKDLGKHRSSGGDYLIHVRTLNGSSLNVLVEVRPNQPD
jgi:hypothetical protein